MKRHIKMIIFVSIFPLLSSISGISAENSPGGFQPVVFRNIKQDTLKTGCFFIKGKYDAFGHYSCPDALGNLRTFDPGDKWEIVYPVCFRHVVRDTVKTGFYKIPAKGKQPVQFAFFKEETGRLVFVQPGKNWKLLDGDDSACLAEATKHPFIPRDFKMVLKEERETKADEKKNGCIRLFPGCGTLKDRP